MRKVVLGLGITLDGYIARPDGSVDFLFMPKDYSMAPFFATVDTAIMGRKSLEAGLKMGGGQFDSGGLATYVFSNSHPPGKRENFTYVNESPAVFVKRLRQQPGKLVLGADTIVVVDGQILGKPCDEADAMRMLRLLSGRTHQVITGICLIGPVLRTEDQELRTEESRSSSFHAKPQAQSAYIPGTDPAVAILLGGARMRPATTL